MKKQSLNTSALLVLYLSKLSSPLCFFNCFISYFSLSLFGKEVIFDYNLVMGFAYFLILLTFAVVLWLVSRNIKVCFLWGSQVYCFFILYNVFECMYVEKNSLFSWCFGTFVPHHSPIGKKD